jgi:hypothetical protein
MRLVIDYKKTRIKHYSALLSKYALQVVLMRLLLDLCFYKYVINAFNSSNYKYFFTGESSIALYIISWAILVPSVVLTEPWFKSESPSKTVLQIIYMIQFVPFTVMFGYSCFPVGFSFFTVLYWIMLFLLASLFLRKDRYCDEHLFEHEERTFSFELVVTIISGLTVLYFGYISGFRVDLNIFNAYDLRADARTFSSIKGSTYLLGLSRILIPTGLVYSIRKKKLWMVVAFLFFFILDYSFDGSKTLYFICIVAVLVALFYNKKFNKYMPCLLNAFLALGYIESLFNPLPNIYRLVIRRLFFVPNVINNAYYDYMLTHNANMFSNLLRFIGINNSYDIAYVIGPEYFHSENMSANTGTTGDALWQFKFIGWLVLPVLIILLVKLLDFCTKEVPFEIVFIPCLVFAYYLNNSSFTAACFSHGLVFFCIIIRLYTGKRFSKNQRLNSISEEIYN